MTPTLLPSLHTAFRPAAAFLLCCRLHFHSLLTHSQTTFPLYIYQAPIYPSIRSRVPHSKHWRCVIAHLQDAPQHSSSNAFLRHPKRLVSDTLLLTSETRLLRRSSLLSLLPFRIHKHTLLAMQFRNAVIALCATTLAQAAP